MKHKLPLYTYFYFFCQFINLTAAVISVSVAAVVGIDVAENQIYATVPYGVQFLCVFLMTYPASIVMKKKGRKFGFYIGALFLALSGIIGFIAVNQKSFTLLVVSHGFLGLFTAYANYYRFAVTDKLSKNLKSKALSFVVAGGVLAGFVAPILVNVLKDVDKYADFSFCYGVLFCLAILNICIIALLPFEKKQSKSQDSTVKPPIPLIVDQKNMKNKLLISILSAAVGYGLMNLIMIQSSLHMNHTHVSFEKSSFAIQWHVVAMFFPSFFTGYLIQILGHIKTIFFGFILFIVCFLINYFSSAYLALFISLILLGLAWNFTYVGGSALLAISCNDDNTKESWQGISDTWIAISATFGAFTPSIFVQILGWKNTNLVSVAVCCFVVASIFILNKKNNSKESTYEDTAI